MAKDLVSVNTREFKIPARSFVLVYCILFLIYFSAFLSEKFWLFVQISLLFLVGAIPFAATGRKFVVRLQSSSGKPMVLYLAAVMLVAIGIYLSFNSLIDALLYSHNELHADASGVTSAVIIIINCSAVLLSRAVVASKSVFARYLLPVVIILLIAIPFSRNPALPAILAFVIFINPNAIVKPLSARNILMGIAIVFMLVLFDLRRAFGTADFFTGQAFSGVSLMDYIGGSAELQVINRVHEGMLSVTKYDLYDFLYALFIHPILNGLSILGYDELYSVRLSQMYPTTGGFSMLVMAFSINPILVPIVSFVVFGLFYISLLLVLRIAPGYSLYAVACCLAFLVNSFRIDLSVALKMLMGYMVAIVLVALFIYLVEGVINVARSLSISNGPTAS